VSRAAAVSHRDRVLLEERKSLPMSFPGMSILARYAATSAAGLCGAWADPGAIPLAGGPRHPVVSLVGRASEPLVVCRLSWPATRRGQASWYSLGSSAVLSVRRWQRDTLVAKGAQGWLVTSPNAI
jgi:hypothetical protein